MGAEKVFGHDAKATPGQDLCCLSCLSLPRGGARQEAGMIVQGTGELESTGAYLLISAPLSVDPRVQKQHFAFCLHP